MLALRSRYNFLVCECIQNSQMWVHCYMRFPSQVQLQYEQEQTSSHVHHQVLLGICISFHQYSRLGATGHFLIQSFSSLTEITRLFLVTSTCIASCPAILCSSCALTSPPHGQIHNRAEWLSFVARRPRLTWRRNTTTTATWPLRRALTLVR